MTRDAWRKSATKDVLFPDDLPGRGPVTVVGEPLDAEEIESDTVQYGTLAELANGHGAEYVVCPVALRDEIATRWIVDEESATFEVLEASRGPDEHDPWTFEFTDPNPEADDG